MGYHIGSFNIRDFNAETLKRDFNKIAEIIVKEEFDVVGIQEVNTSLALENLTRILNHDKNLLREYDYNFGPDKFPKHSDSKDPERYGFIWNSKRLRLLKDPTCYQNAGGVSLQRPPYYARFTARGMLGGSNFELRLVNVHIKSKGTERTEEFDILIKRVLPRICDHQSLSASLEMMPSYTVLLGDYNLCLNKGERATIKIDSITETNYTGKRRYFKTVQEMPTSLRKENNQKTVEECYANNYDHFSYEMNLINKLKLSNVNRIDALNKYFSSEKSAVEKLRAYNKKISDHVPISMDVDLK